MEFLKSENLSLNPAGYLVSTESKKPVFHSEFVSQQMQAEYVVKLAEAVKDKNFTVGKVDNLAEIKQAVLASLNDSAKKYVSEPNKPTSKVNDELVQFALDFDKYHEQTSTSKKINEFMQQFNKIDDVEQVGDYFTEGVIKLRKIYTIAEILEAATIYTEKLG
jgi:hypothetical protein